MTKNPMIWRSLRASRKLPSWKFLAPFEARRLKNTRSLLEDLTGEAGQNTLDFEPCNPTETAVLEYEIKTVEGPCWEDLFGKTRKSLRLLRISNRNVDGLDGAYGNQLPDGSYQKFFDFGADSDKQSGGGSYGYGRSTYFLASSSRRLLVDSVYKDGKGAFRRRLVGVRFMTKQELKDEEQTLKPGDYRCDGLMVWGPRAQTAGVAEILPLEEDASNRHGDIPALVSALGLHRKAGDTTPGTDFYVLDLLPDKELMGDVSNVSLENHIRGAVLWRLWPALQDNKIKVYVTSNQKRTEVILDDSALNLWPLLFFSNLRKRVQGDESALKDLGGSGYEDCSYRHEGRTIVSAAAYKATPLNIPQDPGLAAAYPGNVFLNSKTGVAALVRFRTNGLVVNYDKVLQIPGKELELQTPEDIKTWHLGLLEVCDAELSELIRAGERDPTTDAVKLDKIEDVSHTTWNFPQQMRKFKPVATAYERIADILGCASITAGHNTEQGSVFWTRGLGEIFGARSGAPEDEDDDSADHSSGTSKGSSGKKFLAENPCRIDNENYYVFVPAPTLEESAGYILTVNIESLVAKETYANPKGYILNESGKSTSALDYTNYVHQKNQRIAVLVPEGEPAITVSATKAGKQ